jgi:hypothetical protein
MKSTGGSIPRGALRPVPGGGRTDDSFSEGSWEYHRNNVFSGIDSSKREYSTFGLPSRRPMIQQREPVRRLSSYSEAVSHIEEKEEAVVPEVAVVVLPVQPPAVSKQAVYISKYESEEPAKEECEPEEPAKEEHVPKCEPEEPAKEVYVSKYIPSSMKGVPTPEPSKPPAPSKPVQPKELSTLPCIALQAKDSPHVRPEMNSAGEKRLFEQEFVIMEYIQPLEGKLYYFPRQVVRLQCAPYVHIDDAVVRGDN